jgi:probable HAF family extracellular repeat protein
MLKLSRSGCPIGLLLATGLVAAGGAASASAAQAAPRYVAIDLGTLGGPNAAPSTNGITISPSGVVVVSADTPALNPFPGDPGCLDDPCHVNDAAEWRDGVMTDLGALQGSSAGLFELNGAGVGVGVSETGLIDPLTGFPETHAVISRDGGLVDLGTLGGNESWASGINDRGQVAGYAANTVPDPYAQFLSPYPSATQLHAAIWQGGIVRDLGTLGGPDSIGSVLNARGQVAGQSFTNSTPNATTGIPTMDPFLWQKGVMRDLGTLGGTIGMTSWLNDRGEAVGFSDLAGDGTFHPFLWNGKRLVDLGTLGGDGGAANWVNEAGSVVGSADLLGSQTHHGFLWRSGVMHDLAPVGADPCSNAFVINARGQAVGNDTDCAGDDLGAMLWERGAAFDLNSLVAPTAVHLSEAFFISDRGQIACFGTLPNGDRHVVLLVPAPGSARAPAERSHERAAPHATPGSRDLFETPRQAIAQLSGPR